MNPCQAMPQEHLHDLPRLQRAFAFAFFWVHSHDLTGGDGVKPSEHLVFKSHMEHDSFEGSNCFVLAKSPMLMLLLTSRLGLKCWSGILLGRPHTQPGDQSCVLLWIEAAVPYLCSPHS